MLDQCGIKAIDAAADGITMEAPAVAKSRKRGGTKRRAMVLLRVAMLLLGLLTLLGLSVGIADVFAGGVGLSGAARLTLLAVVAVGFFTQLGGLVRLLPGVRSIRLRRRRGAAPAPLPLLLDQATVGEIAARAALLPPPVALGPRRTSRLAAGGSWFALAIGVVVVLLVAVVGSAGRLVFLAVRGDLLTPAGGMTAGIFAMLGVGTWSTARMVLRSVDQMRLRRRKRALRQLLRAILQWLLGAGRHGRPVFTGAAMQSQVLGLCVLAVAATAVGLGPALAGGGGDDEVVAASADDDGGPAPTRTPTRTPTPRRGATATSGTTGAGAGETATAGGSGGSQGNQQGGGGGSTATATSGSGAGGGAPTSTPPPGATATKTPTPTRTPLPGATATPTRTPTPTPTSGGYVPPPPEPTATPTEQPTRTPTPTATPTPKPTPTPTPTPPPPPTPTPGPSCLTPNDCDGDGVTNAVETQFESDPYNPNSKPEADDYLDGSSCLDGIDNDLDGLKDLADPRCDQIIL